MPLVEEDLPPDLRDVAHGPGAYRHLAHLYLEPAVFAPAGPPGVLADPVIFAALVTPAYDVDQEVALIVAVSLLVNIGLVIIPEVGVDLHKARYGTSGEDLALDAVGVRGVPVAADPIPPLALVLPGVPVKAALAAGDLIVLGVGQAGLVHGTLADDPVCDLFQIRFGAVSGRAAG